MTKKILVTGFKPFLGEMLNPSEMILHELRGQNPEIATLVLPVSYHNSFATLKSHWAQHGPYDVVLMLGQAGGRKAVGLERVALNWSETPHADEDGDLLATGKILPHAADSYFADFFPTEWQTALSKFGPVEISFSAGTFVCNALYFKALHELPKNARILFTHLPYLPEQIAAKPAGTASLEFATQFKIISELIQLMKNI
jgi:pyroglutamyl-peptidase